MQMIGFFSIIQLCLDSDRVNVGILFTVPKSFIEFQWGDNNWPAHIRPPSQTDCDHFTRAKEALAELAANEFVHWKDQEDLRKFTKMHVDGLQLTLLRKLVMANMSELGVVFQTLHELWKPS